MISQKELEHFHKTEECINKFKNGNKRFKESPTFNMVVQTLVSGADVYDIIESLCINLDMQSEAFKQYMIRDTRPVIFGENFFKH